MLAEQQQGDAGDAGDGGAAAAAQLREATAHGELWWRCCGLEDDVAAVLINCYERYTRVEEGYPGPSKEILIDVPRTMPQHPFFASADGQAALARILHAYSQHDPSIAYVQGMGYIAAQLLLHLPEPRAFCVMVCVMQDSKFALRDLLADSLSGLRVAMYQVSRLIEKHYPRMAAHFAAMGVDSHLFFPVSQWRGVDIHGSTSSGSSNRSTCSCGGCRAPLSVCLCVCLPVGLAIHRTFSHIESLVWSCCHHRCCLFQSM